jgi:abhydrolase domain-containing protein 6
MKKKIAAGIGIGFSSLIVAFALTYFLLPGVVFKMAQVAGRNVAGLTEKSVLVDDHRIVYLEGGRGETVLLVHGFAAEKDNWVRFAANLTPGYHVVIPDLAGFGESSRLPQKSYDIGSQVERLNRFTETLKLGKFHLAGNSMGGMIAGIYAAKYPEKVSSLSLLAPGGIRSPEKSELEKMLARGVNPLLIGSDTDFERLLKMVFAKTPLIPYPIRKEAAARAIRNRPFDEKIFSDMQSKRLSLEPFLPEIQAPTLILWGDRDNLLHVSGASVLEKGIRNHRTVILADCGHVPMLERPEETAGYFLSFLITARR